MNVCRKGGTAVLALAFLFALAPERATAAEKGRVDINSASQAELEALPGVGAATAKKIIAGRPYSSVAGLSKAGVSESTIRKISGRVMASRGSREQAPAPAADSRPRTGTSRSSREEPAAPAARRAPASSNSAGPVDLNRASQKELEDLPGVGAVTARKIIGGRPYRSVGDLSRAGVSASTIEKISGLVTVGAESGRRSRENEPAPTADSSRGSGRSDSSAPSAAPARSEPSAAPPASRRGETSSPSTAEYQPPPAAGMVWVNLETKVFHREGDRWYGRTKRGKYMSEAEATKAGYRLSREKGEPGAR